MTRPPDTLARAVQALGALAQVASELDAEVYAVGGHVRDRVAGAAAAKGLTTGDVDALVLGDLERLAHAAGARLGAAVVRLHDKHVVFRLAFPDASHVDLSPPRAGPLCGPEWRAQVEADLRLRDFTVNAMAIPLRQASDPDWRGAVIDPTGGAADLRRGLLRATRPDIWREDPLRLLRAVRLAAQLGLAIEPHTLAGLRDHAHLVTRPAGERIRDELFALLRRDDAPAWLERMADWGLLFRLIPELAPLPGLGPGGYHHLDAWRHSLAVVREVARLAREAPGLNPGHRGALASLMDRPLGGGRPRLALLRLAALLHDIGKPDTFRAGDVGFHFYGHDRLGADAAREVGRRLRLTRKEVHYLEVMVANHLQPAFLAQEQEVSRRAAHRFFRRTRNCAPDVLLLAWADRLSARGPYATEAHVEQTERLCRWLMEEWLERGPLSHPQPPFGARAVMARYHLGAGPLLGQLLGLLRRRHAERPFADADEAWSYLDRVARALMRRAATEEE